MSFVPASNESSSGSRIRHVDAMRGVAALAVALFHFSAGAYGALNLDFGVSPWRFSWLGVHVFFVISGYVIATVACRTAAQVQFPSGMFLAKRMIRLYPPYFVAMLAAVAAAVISSMSAWFRGDPPDLDTARFACNLAYACDVMGLRWFDPVYWTLAIEFQFYLIAAALLSMGKRFQIVAIGIAIAMLLVAPFSPNWLVSHYSGLFVAGASVASFEAGRLSPIRAIAWLTGAAGSMLAALTPSECIASLLALVVLVLKWQRIPRPLLLLGGISYSLYLVHVPLGGRVMNLLARFDLGPVTAALAVVTALIVSIAAAWLFWRVIEVRALEWSRRYGERQARSVAVAETR